MKPTLTLIGVICVIATAFAISVAISHAQTPTASPAATQAAQVRPPRLAPKGIFYLMERVAVKSKSGVAGFAPGTRVKLVKDRGETLLVQSEDTKFEVHGDQLTNDLDLADLLRRQDAQAQRELARAMQDRLAAYQAETEKKNQLSEQEYRELQKKYAAAAEPTPKPEYKNPLDKGPYHEKSSNWPSWRPWIRH